MSGLAAELAKPQIRTILEHRRALPQPPNRHTEHELPGSRMLAATQCVPFLVDKFDVMRNMAGYVAQKFLQ